MKVDRGFVVISGEASKGLDPRVLTELNINDGNPKTDDGTA